MGSQSNHTGWLMVDNRAAGGKLFEANTYTCAHCNGLVVMNPARTRERAVCRKCMKTVCDQCVTECTPFDRIAEQILKGANHG